MILWLGVVSKKIALMSEYRKQRVKELAEAYVRQLRTIPITEAHKVMEHLLDELHKYRDLYTGEPVLPIDRSCHHDPKN